MRKSRLGEKGIIRPSNMKKITKRQLKCIKLYLGIEIDKNYPKTKDNAYQSYIASGYKNTKNAYKSAHVLFNKPYINQEVSRLIEIENSKLRITKEQAILEARKEYEKAINPSERKYWHSIWLELSGYLIDKSEVISHSTVDQKIEYTSDDIANKTREALRAICTN